MIETLPDNANITIYPVSGGMRWVSNRIYAIMVPVDKLSVTEMHTPTGQYRYYKGTNKDGKSKELIKEEVPDILGKLSDDSTELGGPLEIVETSTSNIIGMTGDKRMERDVYLYKPVDKSIQCKDRGIMVVKDYVDVIIELYPNAVPYSIGARIYPIFFIDTNYKDVTKHGIVGLAVGVKYWSS